MGGGGRADAAERLAKRPRAELCVDPTPLLDAKNLARSFAPDGPRILLKMDAWTGPGLGGNKVRKLEYVLAPENREGVDTLITAGSAQSNHARVTASLAARFGLRCVLVLSGDPGQPPRGNAFLHRLFGAKIQPVESPDDREAAMEAAAEEVRRDGGAPLVIPIGASTPTGALGYARAAMELDAQLSDRNAWNRGRVWVVVPSSSCGTLAGLLLGFSLLHRERLRLLAVSADTPAEELGNTGRTLAEEAGRLLGWKGDILADALLATDAYVGRGYGIPTEASHAAVHRLAELEGVVLDPTYTSKAAAGLLDHLRRERFEQDDTVVFLHTGGHPALFA